MGSKSILPLFGMGKEVLVNRRPRNLASGLETDPFPISRGIAVPEEDPVSHGRQILVEPMPSR